MSTDHTKTETHAHTKTDTHAHTKADPKTATEPPMQTPGGPGAPPTEEQIKQSVSDIEKRWKMPMSAVTVMMHNHIFGATTPAMLAVAEEASAEVRRRRMKHRRQQQHKHMKKNPKGLHPSNPSASHAGG